MSQTTYDKSQAAKVAAQQREAAIRTAKRDLEGQLHYGAHYGHFHAGAIISAIEPLSDEDRISALTHALDLVVLNGMETAQLVLDCLAYATTVIETVTNDSPTRPLPDVHALVESHNDDTESDAE